MEVWKDIIGFPGYAVSNLGRVRNEETGRILAMTMNQRGFVHVGLYRDNKQHRRSVAVLVARSFVTPPPFHTFDTPIHLDGDRLNNESTNLLWRPHWFAVKYYRQFENGEFRIYQPIVEEHTGEEFMNSMEAATRFGLLNQEVVFSTRNHSQVWPSSKVFKIKK